MSSFIFNKKILLILTCLLSGCAYQHFQSKTLQKMDQEDRNKKENYEKKNKNLIKKIVNDFDETFRYTSTILEKKTDCGRKLLLKLETPTVFKDKKKNLNKINFIDDLIDKLNKGIKKCKKGMTESEKNMDNIIFQMKENSKNLNESNDQKNLFITKISDQIIDYELAGLFIQEEDFIDKEIEDSIKDTKKIKDVINEFKKINLICIYQNDQYSSIKTLSFKIGKKIKKFKAESSDSKYDYRNKKTSSRFSISIKFLKDLINVETLRMKLVFIENFNERIYTTISFRNDLDEFKNNTKHFMKNCISEYSEKALFKEIEIRKEKIQDQISTFTQFSRAYKKRILVKIQESKAIPFYLKIKKKLQKKQ